MKFNSFSQDPGPFRYASSYIRWGTSFWMSCFLPPEESIHVYPKNLTKSLFNRMGACCTNDKESRVLPPGKRVIDSALRFSPYKKGKTTVLLSFYTLSFIMLSSLNLFSLLKR